MLTFELCSFRFRQSLIQPCGGQLSRPPRENEGRGLATAIQEADVKWIKLSGGEEYDAFCARRFYGWGPGVLKKVKRRYNKRFRKAGKQMTKEGYRD